MSGGARWAAALLLLAAAIAAARQTREEKSAEAAHAMAEERFADAEKLYAELVQAEPANAGLLLSLGIARQSQGKHREALAQFRAVVKANPGAAPAWLLLGISLRALNQADEAAAAFEKVLELDPQNRAALPELAESLFSLARYEDAARRFYEWAEHEAANPRAWQALGLCYLQLARRAAGELEESAPGSAWWFVARAQERRGQGKDAAALALYRHALALDPALRGVHAAIAEIYFEAGKEEWAAAEEKREAALPSPDCSKDTLECEFRAERYWQLVEASQADRTPAGLYWRALAYRRLAAIAFARMDELPLSAELLERKAETLEALGRYTAAVRVWREALVLAPTDTRLLGGLARSLRGAGDWEAVRELAGQLLENEPSSPGLHAIRGEALLALGDARGAIAHLEKAGRKGEALARAYLKTGQPARAEEILRQIRALEDGGLYELLERAYREAGETGPAARAATAARQWAQSPRGIAARLEANAAITAP